MSKPLLIFVITVIIFHSYVHGQPALSFDLKKPQKFENKKLGSEKTGDKKFSLPRRTLQNTITHYNYYYNAERKLDEIIERSKSSFKDDFSQLLPFYNYDLPTTAQFKTELDSVIYKSTAGILLHDLRNDWIDDLYMLIGRAYYLRNELDSAYLTFQYINYAFSPKEEDGYDKVIGTNPDERGQALSISTKEKNGVIRKAFSEPPSRNESFLWQIRTYLQKNEFAEASSLIETLKHDPYFPQRLSPGLEEAQAFLFYKQHMYDSAAVHLEQALVNATSREETARWEYLIAQLYERSGNRLMAQTYYNKAIKRTIDPILEVYARLNSIRQNETVNDKSVQLTIDQLLHMARRDRYLFHRDIIYFTAAEIELERKNYDGARALLLKSAQNSTSNPVQKTKSFFLLADISYEQKLYHDAARYYDSVDAQSITPNAANALLERKESLRRVVSQLDILSRQDSLRRIAALPADERDAYIRRLVRQLRRQQGLTEEETSLTPGILRNNSSNATQSIDLFRNDNAKSDWYFSNASMKSKGYSEFRSKWGSRPNVDNWRRQQAVAQQVNLMQPGTQPGVTTGGAVTATPAEISYDGLLARLPITPEQIQISRDSVHYATFTLAKAYQENLEDYPSAITTYEKLLAEFPESVFAEESLFNLYYCYTKTGDTEKAARTKQTMASRSQSGPFTTMLLSGDARQRPDSMLQRDATKKYEQIYTQFIEGKFDQAINQKKIADSIYGKNYWTPQLLYILAVYHIKQRQDTAAINVLSSILQLYPTSPLALKSQNLIQVVARRKEIETYLTNLQIERPTEDSVVIKNQPVVKPAATRAPVVRNNVPPANRPPANSSQPATNQTTGPTSPPATNQPTTQNVAPPVTRPTASNAQNTLTDSLRAGNKPAVSPNVFTLKPEEAHYVVLVLDKVDPVYVTESRNAFNRYNKERYYNKAIDITHLPLTDDVKLVLFNGYANAAEAIDYIEKSKKLAQSEIIPWLTPQKYSFMIITASNLEVLKNLKDVTAYRKFLTQSYPNFFK